MITLGRKGRAGLLASGVLTLWCASAGAEDTVIGYVKTAEGGGGNARTTDVRGLLGSLCSKGIRCARSGMAKWA